MKTFSFRFYIIQPAIYLSLLFWSVTGYSQVQSPEITQGELTRHLNILAHDTLKGRKSGTPEDLKAAVYIREQFRNYGIKLIYEDGFQEFDIVNDVTLGKNNKLSFNGFEGKLSEDFTPVAFTFSGSATAEVAFLGYGLKSDSARWNDYAGFDAKGKWVMVLRGAPDIENPDASFSLYYDDRSKALVAKDAGAIGVILVNGKDIDKEDDLMPLLFDKSIADAGIPVININRKTANLLLTGLGKDIESLEKSIKDNKTTQDFLVPVTVAASADVALNRSKTRNIVGIIRGSDPVLRDEYIVIGAHYDHLGMGGPGSGSRVPDSAAVHNGADDNASGVASIIEIAGKLSANQKQLKRGVIVVAFGAEEMGILGSKYFMAHPPVPEEKIKAMVNLDMVGRLSDSTLALTVGGSGTSTQSETLLNEVNKNYNFNLRLSPEGYGPSDHASFYSKNIPVFFITTSAHYDYHTPLDDVDRLNIPGQLKVTEYTCELVQKLSSLDEALVFQEAGPKQGSTSARRFKVSLGIMPDVSGTETNGVGVDGVRKGGPADMGNMQKGDVIVGIDGKPVHNIYEYMDRLKSLKSGQTVNVDILRKGKPEVLIIQL